MSCNEDLQRKNLLFKRHGKIDCNCGWEARFGYGVAVTLAIFEAKRFFMLILEIFAEWQVIRFAGGLRPVIFTVVDISVGLPAALVAVRTIRTQKVPRCCTRTKRILKCLLLIIIICAGMNVGTLASIGYHITVKQERLIDIFNASMHFYINTASYKYAIDEIQFIFQCCGHSSYTDWFLFDWQKVDYASREEMSGQNKISDEEYRDRGVPYSCCDLRAMMPCVHTEIANADVKTINTSGCAEIISPVLLRIVIVAYVMTSTLVVTQILLAFLIIKIIRKLLPEICFYYFPAVSVNESTSVSFQVTSSETERLNSTTSSTNCEPGSSKETTKLNRRRPKRTKRRSSTRCIRSRNKSRLGDNSNSSSSQYCAPGKQFHRRALAVRQAAKIKPSTHVEHTISKKHFYAGTR